jgi:hypothetical protein
LGDRHRLRFAEHPHDPADAERDQHDRHQHLERQGHPRGQGQVEDDDGDAHRDDGHGVAHAPERSHERARPEAAGAGHDGGDRHHVVGIGRVLDPEEQAQQR